MISPEVVNFSPPRTLLQRLSIHGESQLSNYLLMGKLGSHFHAITAVLPDVQLQDTDDLFGVYEDEVYYQVQGFPIHQFLEPDFLHTFIKNGSFHARTTGTWNDVDPSAVLEDGVLKLSVTKDVYQELGLTGEPELILGRQVAKYCITINLLDTRFVPTGKFYQRVMWCLKDRLDLTFDWIMMWTPSNEEVCPSSVAACLDLKGFRVVQCVPRLKQHQLQDVRVPSLSSETELADLVEWVGAAALGIKCSDEESYTSSLTCPEPNVVVSRVTVLHWTGFFHKEQVKMLIQLLLPLHKPWVNLTLHSFDDDCTSAPHGLIVAGMNCWLPGLVRTTESGQVLHLDPTCSDVNAKDPIVALKEGTRMSCQNLNYCTGEETNSIYLPVIPVQTHAELAVEQLSAPTSTPVEAKVSGTKIPPSIPIAEAEAGATKSKKARRKSGKRAGQQQSAIQPLPEANQGKVHNEDASSPPIFNYAQAAIKPPAVVIPQPSTKIRSSVSSVPAAVEKPASKQPVGSAQIAKAKAKVPVSVESTSASSGPAQTTDLQTR